MTIRKTIAVVHLIAALMFSLSAHAQTIRDRMRERREAREQQVNPNYPAKGDLALARKVELTFNGVRRYYLVEAPKGPGPFPVVILLHGGTGSAEEVWRQTSLPTLTRNEGFIVVAPNGLNKHWNDGPGTTLGGGASAQAEYRDAIQTLRDSPEQGFEKLEKFGAVREVCYLDKRDSRTAMGRPQF